MAASDPIRPLVQEYAEAASAHRQATVAGDSQRANQTHDVVAAIYRRLREHGEQRQLLPLLHHDDPAVVAWAGAHALEFAPQEGERALTELAQRDDGIIGFDAQTTLSGVARRQAHVPVAAAAMRHEGNSAAARRPKCP